MNSSLHYLPATELSARVRTGDLSAVHVIESFIDRYHQVNDKVNGIITLADTQAMDRAVAIDDAMRRGETLGPLAGVPITVKDALPTAGIRTTFNSYVEGENWHPAGEPLVITRLREAGAIILGKANANEFLGIPSDNDRFPRPRSPYNTDYVSIGSSSGSGVSVAAGLCAASIGTDSAGSVRLPAAQAGLYGLKATNGRITREGMSRHSTLQVIGALTRTTADSALFYDVMAGQQTFQQLGHDVKGWRIGVPWHYIETAPVEDEVAASFKASLDTLQQLGAEIVEIEIRGLAEGRMATFVVLYTEHHAGHQKWLRKNFTGYGDSARLYAMQGAFIATGDYLNAREMGYRLQRIIDGVLQDVDFIAMPTSPFVTAEAGRRPSEHRQGINTAFTGFCNLTGHPAMTIPCGVSALGIPIGTQLIAAHDAELSLLQLSQAYEQVTTWHHLHPEL